LFSSNAEIQRSKDLCEDLRRREQALEGQVVDRELMNKENERTLMADQNKLNSLRLEVDSVELDIQRSDKQIEIQRRDNESLRVQIT
jgi:hypothetical protein